MRFKIIILMAALMFLSGCSEYGKCEFNRGYKAFYGSFDKKCTENK